MQDLHREYPSPGVYLETSFSLPYRGGFCTGVPVFLGFTTNLPPKRTLRGAAASPRLVTVYSQFIEHFGRPKRGSYLAYAVRGFFENGGERCYVLPIDDITPAAVTRALDQTANLFMIDLICFPDLVQPQSGMGVKEVAAIQTVLMEHALSVGGRFVILDTPRSATWEDAWQNWWEIDGADGAIYYPWVCVRGWDGSMVPVPPCGHIAGVYSRTDRVRGVHKTPANEALYGVLELDRYLTSAEQDFLNPKGINCLRSFPGRGIRVWGGRTLSGQEMWRYISVRRIFLTANRWIQTTMTDVTFESITPALWARIERELFMYFMEEFRRGALTGRTPQEAFYVRCDEHTNPPEIRERGQAVAEIGLATSAPFEFVVVRLIHGATGVRIAGPFEPWETKRGE